MVYEDDLVLIQMLLNRAEAVAYFAVTTRDFDFKARSPIDLHCDQGRRTTRLILNVTKVGWIDCGDRATVFGLLGASYSNFGFAFDGSHANSWRYSVAGLNLFGNQYTHGKDTWGEGENVDVDQTSSLYEAQIEMFNSVDSPPSEYKAEETRRRAECAAELTIREPWPGLAPLDPKWVNNACADATALTQQQVEVLRSSQHWRQYMDEGTVNTFAITEPHLLDHGALIFYGIWDIGPTEESFPG